MNEPLKPVAITCPNCGSADLSARGPSDYRCNHCGSFFLGKPAAPSPPPPYSSSAPRPSGAPFAAIAIGVVVAMTFAGAATAFFLIAKPVAPPPVDLPPPTTPISYDRHPADAQGRLGAQVEGSTRVGGRFWLIDYENTGDAEITNPAVAVSLFDQNGTRVGEQTGYATVKRLQAGQRTTILVLLNEPPAYDRAQIEMVKPASDFALEEVGLAVTDFRENKAFGSLRDIIGTVKNETTRKVRFVNVLVVGRDASNRPVSYASGIATQSEIDAGGESGFSINVGTFELEPPARWDVIAVGSPL